MPKSFAQKIRDVMRIDLKDREEFTYEDIAPSAGFASRKAKRSHLSRYSGFH